MFVRLKNELDFEAMEKELSSIVNSDKVMKRIKEILQMIDNSYGVNRGSRDMGGYVYLFSDISTYDKNIFRMLDVYHLSTDMYEYSDTICNDFGKRWQEELYLISSDDAIIVIHP